jgi:hypothetical protein
MSVIWADNFQAYGTDEAAMTNGLYAQVDTSPGITLENDPDPLAPAGSRVVRFPGNGDPSSGSTSDINVRFAFPNGPTATMGASIRLYCPELPIADDQSIEIFRWANISNVDILILELLTTGALRIRHIENGTILGTSVIPVIAADNWAHIEMKVLFSDTVGTTEVRVNGNEVSGLTLTSQDTIASGGVVAAQVAFTQRATSTSSRQRYYIRDFILWDTLGTQNNNFMGTLSIINLYPDADSSLNWAPSTGATGWNLIDEVGPNDTDYIAADDTLPAASVFNLTDLPADIVGVRALIPINRSRKSDAGDGNVQQGVRSGASTDTGANTPVTTAFSYRWDVSELNPATGVAYTPLEVNAVEYVINRTL